MDLAQELIPRALSVALAFSRTAGFVAVSPFPGRHVGATQRVGAAIVLAWLASSIAPPHLVVRTLDAQAVVASVSELGLGLLLGMTFRFVYGAAEVLSQNVAQATGLGTPSVFNPTIETQETALGEAITLFALLMAFAVGAHRIALAWVFESFRVIPVGSPVLFTAATGTFVDLAGESLLVGLRLALPVVAVALATQVTLAMIARAAPSLQIFNVGLAVLIAAGTMVLLASATDLAIGLGNHMASLSPRLDQLLVSLTPPSPAAGSP